MQPRFALHHTAQRLLVDGRAVKQRYLYNITFTKALQSHNSELLGIPARHKVLVRVEELCDGLTEALVHCINFFLAWGILLHHCRTQLLCECMHRTGVEFLGGW